MKIQILFSTFNKIIDSEVIFTGDINEEIEENWWAIKIKPSLATKVSLDQLKQYVNTLLDKRREQVAEYGIPATFYMWVDEQSFQLQLNILSGHTLQLPFRCKVNIVNNLNELLEKYVEISRKGVISFDEVVFDDEVSDEEDDSANYTRDVFVELM